MLRRPPAVPARRPASHYTSLEIRGREEVSEEMREGEMKKMRRGEAGNGGEISR
jgi:hypothetical protein